MYVFDDKLLVVGVRRTLEGELDMLEPKQASSLQGLEYFTINHVNKRES